MNRTTLNLTALKILNSLETGDNVISLNHIAKNIGKSITTAYKYINLLEKNKLIKKTVVGLAGGTENDSRLQTILHKF